jgi:hypothetical protein
MPVSARFPRVLAVISLALLACSAAGQLPRRRALLVGINDYSASRLGAAKPSARGDWGNLNGATTDVTAMAEMLVLLYGFDRKDIVILTDQSATRAAILRGLDQHLLAPVAKGDNLLFYYAGHGSQVTNSRSDEPDKLDESLVPADSRTGAPDIRDKELRPLFNRMLDRGAALTVILDNCHSGSGARALFGGAPRGIKPDPRDIADATPAGPRPEDRGALVLAASQDFDSAYEMRDEHGTFHGAFSWAWLRALRDSTAGEPAGDTFLRAQAQLRAESPIQEPVMAGNAAARSRPFMGVRTDRRATRTVVGVERVRKDGVVVLQGGWANGLTTGSKLRVAGASLTVTHVLGLGRSEARVDPARDRAAAPIIRSGALAEVSGWTAPASRPLRVWVPRIAQSPASLASQARALAAEAARRDIRWIDDPTATTPTHLLRWRAGEWELFDRRGDIRSIAASPAAAVAKIPRGATLFVQFPVPARIVDDLDVSETVDNPAGADYILVGRYTAHRLEYAWMRPDMDGARDRRRTALPVRTDWLRHTSSETASALRDQLLRLRRLQAWHVLESPPEARSPYHLGLRHARTNELVTGTLLGKESYNLVLRAVALPRLVQQRYIYVFMIDTFGKAFLLFPRSGSVENRFPLAGQENAPREIPLGATSFSIAPPYGIDSYFLLTTDEPLVNPAVLEWDGVRSRVPRADTALERLLLALNGNTRTVGVHTPANWSIENLVLESVAPRLQKRAVRPR